ncbi:MAG: metalloregulator ArsR/SmtB family transcription factor [Phycisphaeraceae bacterium]|nr:metalloregulator ArsR/SmtB family transcription factor [Phycisphaeraceae bacterium]
MNKAALHPDKLVEMIASLADATRLRLLRLLEQQELGVAELCEIVQMPQSTVSRHLKLLADQNWLTNRRQATANLYRMVMDELEEPARKLWLLAREQVAGGPTFRQDQLRLNRLLQDRRGDAQAFFAGAAEQWDKLREQLYGPGLIPAVIGALVPAHWVVVDLGCGTGQLAQQLAGVVKKVIGVDNSPAMLKAAKARVRGVSNVELHEAEVENLPLAEESCDAAMMALILTYLPQPQEALAEMARILRPGGKAVVIDLLRHDREDFRRQMGQQAMGFEPTEVELLLRNAGMKEAKCQALAPDPRAKGPALFLATATKNP